MREKIGKNGRLRYNAEDRGIGTKETLEYLRERRKQEERIRIAKYR